MDAMMFLMPQSQGTSQTIFSWACSDPRILEASERPAFGSLVFFSSDSIGWELFCVRESHLQEPPGGTRDLENGSRILGEVEASPE